MGSSLHGLCGPVRSKLVGCDHGLGLPACAVVVREKKNQHLVRPVPILVHLISRLSSHHVWSGLRLCLHAAFLYERRGEIIARLAAKPTILSSCHQLTYSSRTEAACMQTPPLLRLNQEVHRSAAVASWFVWIRSGPCPCMSRHHFTHKGRTLRRCAYGGCDAAGPS